MFHKQDIYCETSYNPRKVEHLKEYGTLYPRKITAQYN